MTNAQQHRRKSNVSEKKREVREKQREGWQIQRVRILEEREGRMNGDRLTSINSTPSVYNPSTE